MEKPSVDSIDFAKLSQIVFDGSAIALDAFRSERVRTTKKGVVDLVTELDVAVERYIVAELAKAFPGVRIVAEESAILGDATNTELTFYLDPIDGTTNFAHGHPIFATSLGLAVGGQPRFGIVHAPALGITWEANREGVFRTSPQGRSDCRVSKVATLSDALCATGFPYSRWTSDDDNTRELAAVLKKAQGIRRCGAASIDICFVADGTYEAYWEQGVKAWDVCAGLAILEAAGGTWQSYEGTRPHVEKANRLVMSNGLVQDELFALVTAVRREHSLV